MTGTWYYYGLNGEVTDVVDYVNDMRHGEWIGFYPSGGLLEIVRYQRDKKRCSRFDEFAVCQQVVC